MITWVYYNIKMFFKKSINTKRLFTASVKPITINHVPLLHKQAHNACLPPISIAVCKELRVCELALHSLQLFMPWGPFSHRYQFRRCLRGDGAQAPAAGC